MPAKKTAKKSTASPAAKAPAAKKAGKKAAKKTVAKKSAGKTAEKTDKSILKTIAIPAAAKATPDIIARAAYLNYRRRVEQGLPGDHESDWLEAERQCGG